MEALIALPTSLQDNAALRRILDLNHEISFTDSAGRIMEVNDRFCSMSGYSRDELIGQPHSIVNSGAHSSAFWSDMWCTITAGGQWRGEICNRGKSGSLRWGESSIVAVPRGSEGLDRFVSIFTDCTASRLLRDKLKSSESLLVTTGRSARIGGWEVDLETDVITWSEQMNRLNDKALDYRPTLQDGFALYTDDSRSRIERAVADARRTGTGWDLVLQKSTALGEPMWVRVVGEVESDRGRPVRVLGTMQDITAQKRIETSLKYERDLMSSMLETLPDHFYFKDTGGKFLRVNPGLARHYRMANVSEAIGRSDADYFNDAHAQRVAAIERGIIDSGQPVLELQELQEWVDRPATWSLTSRMPLFDGMDRLIGTLGVSRDISAQKRIDAQLHATSERFALASGSAGIGSWEFDVEKQALIWDDRMYLLYGLTRTEPTVPLTVWINSLHPDDRVRCERELAASLLGTPEFESEFRILRPDGEVLYLKAASRALRAPDGTALRLTGVNIDMSQYKRAQLQLAETSSQLATVLDSVTKVAIFATDANLTIKLFNAGAEQLLGYTSAELIGHATPMLLHDPVEIHARSSLPDGAAASWAMVARPEMLKKPYPWTYLRKDGSRVPVSQTVVAMHSVRGELLGYVGVARDVTMERQYEQSLLASTHKAEQASSAKSRFLANMSHEIRTPMNAVVGLAYLLEQTSPDERQSDLLRKLNAASGTLLALINDVLDLSKIEAGELIVDNGLFSLSETLQQVADEMAVHASKKAIAFRLEVPEELPANLQGDARRLKQILTNLLSNAIRFTDRGGVVLRVSQVYTSPQSVKLCFSVQDSGIGISPEAQARLFMPFAQADISISRRFGGTGLGLSIVKSLIDLMGGEISLASEPGVGSEFKVIVNFNLGGAEAPIDRFVDTASADKRALLDVRVLLVDDSDVNLEVTKRILELSGAHVCVASNGLEAVEQLRARPHEFDVVLMDVQMPVLGGCDATQRIRRDLGLIDLPIVALTAGALSSERQLALAAGMDDFVIKPFDPQSLVRCMLRHIKVAAAYAATPLESTLQSQIQAPTTWPQVAGIDSTLARKHLLNDFGLFQSGLKRLLREFSMTAIPAEQCDPLSLVAHAGRMHKLKGIAGTLGATQIQRLAADAEVACRAGEMAQANQLATAIRGQLALIRDGSSTVLEADHRQTESVASVSDGDLAPALLGDFVLLLRQQNLAAADRFVALSPQLRAQLGNDDFARLREHIDNLEFAEAARLLGS